MSETCKVCSNPAVLKCSLCKSASYCSKEHQKQDWKKHREACLPFEVKSSPELGRYLQVSRALNTGDVIISESPVVVGPREGPMCLGCYKIDAESRCLQCGWPACDPQCPGLTDVAHHGAECVLLRMYARKVQVVEEDFFRYEAILPLRCLLLQCRAPKKWLVLQGMEAHMKKRGPNTEIYKQVQENVVNYLTKNFFAVLDQIEGGNKVIEDRSAATIHRIMGVIEVNAMEFRLSSGQNIFAIYPTSYLMEHNCLPNTRLIINTENFKLTVRANQQINIGQHISHSYTDTLWGTHQRQEHLKTTKYFLCRCKRCGDPTELNTNISALKCLAPAADRKICGGAQLPVSPLDQAAGWRCENCPTSLTTDQVMDLVNMIGQEVDSVLEKNPTVEALSTLLDKLRKLLHKNHYHCFHVAHSLIQLIGRQPGFLVDQLSEARLQDKLKMCRDLLYITTQLDPSSSRLMLYSSVIRMEMYNAIIALVRRDAFDQTVSNNLLVEAHKQLQEARNSLEVEEKDSPGGKLLNLVETSIEELKTFCSINSISLV